MPQTTFRGKLIVTQKKTSTGNLLGALAIIALFVLGGFVGLYILQNNTLQGKNNQIDSLQAKLTSPKLTEIDLQYADNRTNPNAPFLQVTCYVVNVGGTEANNCTIQVSATQSGNATAINTSKTIPSLDPGTYETVDLQFQYTGQPLMTYTSTLTWTN